MLSFQHIFQIFTGTLTVPSLGFFILTIILSIFNTNIPKNIDLEDQSFPIDTIMEGFSTMSQDTILINVRNSKMCVYWKNSDEITIYPAKIPAYISISEVKAIDNCPNITTYNLKSDSENNDLTTFIDLVPTMFGSSFNGTNKGISITLAIVSCFSLFLMSLLSNKDNIIEFIDKIKEYKNKSDNDVNTKNNKINVNAKGNGINVVVNVSKKSEDENNIEIKNKTTLHTKTELKDEENPKDSQKDNLKSEQDKQNNNLKDNQQSDQDKQQVKENLSSPELIKENISTDTQIKINQRYVSQRNSLNNSPRNDNDDNLNRRTSRPRSNSPRDYTPEPRLSRPCSKNHSRKNSDQLNTEFLDELSGTQTPVKRRLSLKNLPTNVSELTFNTNENGNIDLELELAPEDMYTPRTINDEDNKNINDQNIIDDELKRLQKEISIHEIQDKK